MEQPPVADPGPVLPEELEQEIFSEWAYHLSPASAGNFMLVAHRVYRWIASLVFNVAQQIDIPYFPNPPYSSPSGSTSLGYFGEFVKHLIIGGHRADIQKIKEFLNGCRNLIDLALWSSLPTREFLYIFAKLLLQRLSTNLSSLKDEDFKGPAFSSITHLDVTDLGGDWSRWKALAHVPQLTHIAINEVVDMKAIHYLLRHCNQLRILLVLSDSTAHWNLRGTQVEDPRFVLMTMVRYISEEWESGAKGNEYIWDCAEAISTSKTYGRIKKEHFCTWFSEYEWRKQLDELENAAS